MSSSRPNNLFIYGQMQPTLADRIIKDHLDKLFPDEQKQLATAHISVWLLRESREKGMLTLHQATYSAEKHKWILQVPQRLALQANGWINANVDPKDLIKLRTDLEEVDRDMVDTHANQLEKYIQETFGLTAEGRINPELNQQTTSRLYSRYAVQSSEEKSATHVALPADISESLRSQLSKEIFVNPVVCRFTKGPLKSGVTYERDDLIKFGLEAGTDFYDNLLLKNIIHYIGAQHDKLSKLEKIEEYEINDAITCEKIKNACITPAGNSFSASTIMGVLKKHGDNAKDPLSPSVTINKDNVLPNYNLDKFISAWPSFYKKRCTEEKAASNEAKSDLPAKISPKEQRF